MLTSLTPPGKGILIRVLALEECVLLVLGAVQVGINHRIAQMILINTGCDVQKSVHMERSRNYYNDTIFNRVAL
jgi:hypothetical protein